MIKASAFIKTDTLILLASAITLTTFVYLASSDKADSLAERQTSSMQNRIANNNDISPVGKLVIAHDPADASAVLKQLATLDAVNVSNGKTKASADKTEANIENQPTVSDTALNTAIANANPAAETTQSSVAAAKTETPAATVVPLAAPNAATTQATYAQPSRYRPYYGMPFPMPRYQMPPPVNPYLYQYGYAPYPTHR